METGSQDNRGQRLTLLEAFADLKMSGVIEAGRTINGKTSRERRLCISSIASDARTLANGVRATLRG